MRMAAWMAAFGMAALLAAGCGRGEQPAAAADSPHDQYAQELVSGMAELNEVLEGITDEDSAHAAKSRLEAVGERMKAVQDRIEAAEEPSEAEEARLTEKYGAALEEQAERLQAQFIRIAMTPGLADVVSEPLEKALGGLDGGME